MAAGERAELEERGAGVSYPLSGSEVFSTAMCKLCGIDPARCRSVQYNHRVGEVPTITFEMMTPDPEHLDDDGAIASTLKTFEWRRRDGP